MEATVAERGQITLPKAVRDALGLTKGTQLKVELERRLDHPAQERRRRAVAPARPLQAAAGREHRRRHARAARPRARATRSTRLNPMIAVDSSVLIDLLGRRRARRSGRRVRLRQALGARPGRRLRRRRRRSRAPAWATAPSCSTSLEEAGIRFSPTEARSAVRAGEMQRRYKAAPEGRGRRDRSPRAVPDFLIGAHALLQCSGLITRDAGFFRDYFKGLKVIVPTPRLTFAVEPSNISRKRHDPRFRHHAEDLQDRSGKTGSFFSLPELQKTYPNVARLPVSMRIVLESVLRNCDGKKVTRRARRRSSPAGSRTRRATDEIPFVVARVVLQDFTGVPLLADLAAMRSVAAGDGQGPEDRSSRWCRSTWSSTTRCMIDYFGTKNALDLNMKLEFQRNHERYQFMKWGMQAFDTFGVVPPGFGIVHQVNLEYLARGVHKSTTPATRRLLPRLAGRHRQPHDDDQRHRRRRLGRRRHRGRGRRCSASRSTS